MEKMKDNNLHSTLHLSPYYLLLEALLPQRYERVYWELDAEDVHRRRDMLTRTEGVVRGIWMDGGMGNGSGREVEGGVDGESEEGSGAARLWGILEG